jgi:predicted nucleic acid-binding protein
LPFDASETVLARVLCGELHLGGSSVPYRKEGTMPRPTLKIVASQRDALYEQVRNHLAGLGDVVVALECQRDYPTAERMAIEFGEDFRLMADLGWQPQDGRDTVELTMQPHDLMEVAKRLRDEAHAALQMLKRTANRLRRRPSSKATKTRDTCDTILAALAEAEGGDIRVRRA